jgi:hypothetical protein
MSDTEISAYKGGAIALLVLFFLNTFFVAIRMGCYKRICSIPTVLFVVTSLIVMAVAAALTVSLTKEHWYN